MDLWMLKGVVSDSDVVILNRTEKGYKTSDIFNALATLSSGENILPSPSNTGFRYMGRGDMLEYDHLAQDMGLLQLGVSDGSLSNIKQYEVLYELTTRSGAPWQSFMDMGLSNEKGRLFVFGFPGMEFINLEEEVQRYYELYRREVLVKL